MVSLTGLYSSITNNSVLFSPHAGPTFDLTAPALCLNKGKHSINSWNTRISKENHVFCCRGLFLHPLANISEESSRISARRNTQTKKREVAVIVVLANAKGVLRNRAIFNDCKKECDFSTYFCFNANLVHVVDYELTISNSTKLESQFVRFLSS